jgi:hypothetical protein
VRRKDYELIAAALHRSNMAAGIGAKPLFGEGMKAGVRLVAIDLAATLEHDNPRFDRARFLKACGVES